MERKTDTESTITITMPSLGTFRMIFLKEKVSLSLPSRITLLAISKKGSLMAKARKNLANTSLRALLKTGKKGKES